MDSRPISLADGLSIPDIMDQSRYVLRLGQIPGTGDTEHLSIKCFNAVIPGFANEAFEATMGGFTFNFRGRRLTNNPISVSFYEDSNMETLSALRAWHERIAGTRSNNSEGYIDQYSVDAELSLFDTTGSEAGYFSMYRVYPVDVPEITVDATSSAPVQVQVSFRLTYVEYSNTVSR